MRKWAHLAFFAGFGTFSAQPPIFNLEVARGVAPFFLRGVTPTLQLINFFFLKEPPRLPSPPGNLQVAPPTGNLQVDRGDLEVARGDLGPALCILVQLRWAGDRRLGRRAGGLLTLGGPRGPLLKIV